MCCPLESHASYAFRFWGSDRTDFASFSSWNCSLQLFSCNPFLSGWICRHFSLNSTWIWSSEDIWFTPGEWTLFNSLSGENLKSFTHPELRSSWKSPSNWRNNGCLRVSREQIASTLSEYVKSQSELTLTRRTKVKLWRRIFEILKVNYASFLLLRSTKDRERFVWFWGWANLWSSLANHVIKNRCFKPANQIHCSQGKHVNKINCSDCKIGAMKATF